MTVEDGDETNGFDAGPDFPTNPAGYNTYNLGMMVAAMSPLEAADSNARTPAKASSMPTLKSTRSWRCGMSWRLNMGRWRR